MRRRDAMWRVTLRDILEGFSGRRGRFALTFLAVAIGVVALTTLIAVLGALQDKSKRLVEELGANVVGIISENREATERGGLSTSHVDLLAANLPGLRVTTVRSYRAPTLGTREQLSVVATDHHLMDVRQWRLVEGRFLDREDLRQGARHAVISRSLADAWSWRSGSIVYIGEMPFVAVGIVDMGAAAADDGQGDPRLALGDRVVLIPRSVPPYWSRHSIHRRDAVDAIFVRGRSHQNARQLLPAVQRVLTQPDQQAGTVSWITPDVLVRGVSSLQNTIALVAGTIAALCLVLGGTTLMSLMVANVRERVTEIGLRRAIGATTGDIAFLFVAEAVLITLAAGLAGTAAAHILLAAAGDLMPLPVQPGWASLVLPPLSAVLLGVLFSYAPSRIAGRITPSEALRDE